MIPSSKVLDKISELAAKAKTAQTKEQQLGYIVAMKTLCELLEQEAGATEVASPAMVGNAVHNAEQKVLFEDANGTSLLDF